MRSWSKYWVVVNLKADPSHSICVDELARNLHQSATAAPEIAIQNIYMLVRHSQHFHTYGIVQVLSFDQDLHPKYVIPDASTPR